MLLVPNAFDLHELTTFLNNHIVEHPELLNARLPVGQLVLS